MLKPPEREQRQRLGPSDPAKLDLAWERFGTFAKELLPVAKRHWRAVGSNRGAVPLDPDWGRYFDYDLAGFLHCLVVRSRGDLVGYAFYFVHPHLHYASTAWAHADITWLEPEHRRGAFFSRMIDEAERYLAHLGVKVVQINRKLAFDARLGTLFERKGYKPDEMIYTKVLHG